MQNVAQGSSSDTQKLEKVNVQQDIEKSSTPISSNSSPTKSETETYIEHIPRYMTDTSDSEDEDVSEGCANSFLIDQSPNILENQEELPPSKFLLTPDETEHSVDPETQARLEALLKAAGKLSSGDGKHLADPEVLRRLTSSVSCALDEAAAALTRMRSENPPRTNTEQSVVRSLVEACSEGDVGTVRKLLTEGRSVHETTEEGESLLSLSCSAGYFELAQVLLAMEANVEDRGIKGDCTPLMEAASAGFVEIVRLLIAHGADVNAQSSSGNTPLMYACASGHCDVVKILLEAGGNVEDHNENGHTPLMEAASAGHVNVAKILLENGAGINTHSNEFKESALTLACYKGHLDMVRFLLDAGADQEHKTDEMHTALMEASMDGHVEVARLLLDSGAQVNMPTDSFESPLTLAACGGHVDLAMLLIERGANIEEVNDEGYTPLMEAAREGHEEMVALLLTQGASINTQTEETQETALTLACCGGFTDVAEFLIKAGADIEQGASTPLMEAAQEGHLDLVRFLLSANADVMATTQTGDTALTYACENGHTDVADLLLAFSSRLEHPSEGGRTPLMKACRAGHLCTVQFLITKGADVNRQTTNNDHTPLSLACAGGHLAVVELLLGNRADPFHKLKDNSTMLIEAAKGGHTNVVQLLLDYPHSIMMNHGHSSSSTQTQTTNSAGLHEVPEAVRVSSAQETLDLSTLGQVKSSTSPGRVDPPVVNPKTPSQKSLLRKSRPSCENTLTSPEAQQVRNQPLNEGPSSLTMYKEEINDDKNNTGEIDKARKQQQCREEQIFQKQQILEELQRVERELQEKGSGQLLLDQATQLQSSPSNIPSSLQSLSLNLDFSSQGVSNQAMGSGTIFPHSSNGISVPFYIGKGPQNQNQSTVSIGSNNSCLSSLANAGSNEEPTLSAISTSFPPLPPPSASNTPALQPATSHPINTSADVVQATAISDRPKAKPVSKKEGKNLRKLAFQASLALQQQQQHHQSPLTSQLNQQHPPNFHQSQVQSTQTPTQSLDTQLTYESFSPQMSESIPSLSTEVSSIFSQQDRCQLFATSSSAPDESLSDSEKTVALEASRIDLEDVAAALQGITIEDEPLVISEGDELHNQQYTGSPLEEAISVAQAGVEYFAVPSSGINPSLQLPTSGLHLQYQQYQLSGGLQVTSSGVEIHASGPLEVGGGIQITNNTESTTIGRLGAPFQSQILQLGQTLEPSNTSNVSTTCSSTQYIQPPCSTHQVQVATQTPTDKKPVTVVTNPSGKGKKARYHQHLQRQQSNLINAPSNLASNSYPPDSNNGGPYTQCPQASFSCMEVDSETDSNHDTALTVACAGGHEELVELLLSRGADIEHRDKKGFTPLILAATAGHEKVVEILLNHGADIEAQSERTKDTPLSLACSGGRYEVVELLLTRGANKEHRNVSDYTPLSLAASGGYVNIIKLLLAHGAEINSRTGSKLGISPLMLAAMNGHTAAVKLLLDMGSDINAQIETNRNTALTLACFQGRHEVVSLLLDRKAHVEHRAKTGLTPLMEAASGGYVEVGRVLLDKGADVNAPPVPSSRDTALTIAADKGHCRFVQLLLSRGAQVEVKNKKGNSPLWLAANGGHLPVVEHLFEASADIDSQDNRKVSCLMAAFRKGHTKVVKWMVDHVTQFPSDQEMTRFIATVNDKELLEKCNECVKIIRAAKDQQAAKANKNAIILLEELDMEKIKEESKKATAARRRERKRKKKLEKKEEKRKLTEENKKNETIFQENESGGKQTDDEEQDEDDIEVNEDCELNREEKEISPITTTSNITTNSSTNQITTSTNSITSLNTCSSAAISTPNDFVTPLNTFSTSSSSNSILSTTITPTTSVTNISDGSSTIVTSNNPPIHFIFKNVVKVKEIESKERWCNDPSSSISSSLDNPKLSTVDNPKLQSRTSLDRKSKHLVFEASRPHPAEREDFEATGNDIYIPTKGKKTYQNHFSEDNISNNSNNKNINCTKQAAKRGEDGWKEVVRKLPKRVETVKEDKISRDIETSKKVMVPMHAISRVIGRGGSNINAIRAATLTHIEVEKQSKGQGDRTITIKGSVEATKQAHAMILALIDDPEVDITQMFAKNKLQVIAISTSDKTIVTVTKTKTSPSKPLGVYVFQNNPLVGTTNPASGKLSLNSVGTSVPLIPSIRNLPSAKSGPPFSSSMARNSAPRLLAAAEKKAAAQLAAASITKTTMSYTSAIMTSCKSTKVVSTASSQSFAAKLTETSTAIQVPSGSTMSFSSNSKPRMAICPGPPQMQMSNSHQQTLSTCTSTAVSPKHHRPQPTASAPPSIPGQYQITPTKAPFSSISSTTTMPVVSMSNTAIASSGTGTNLNNANISCHGNATHGNSTNHNEQGRSNTPLGHEFLEQMACVSVPSNKEYSLFNDPIEASKHPVWARDSEPPSPPKGTKFIHVNSSGCVSSVEPKEVDAAKAPGYRGAAVCSPVSKTRSSSTTPPSMPLTPGTTYQNVSTFAPEQCLPISSGGSITMTAKQPQVQTPHNFNTNRISNSDTIELMNASTVPGLGVVGQQSPFPNRGIFPGSNAMPHSVIQPPSQNTLERTPIYNSTYVTDHQNTLKLVPSGNEQQPGQPHVIPSFQHHGHHLNFQVQPSVGMSLPSTQPNTNTTVSMSRLNPRAPDFSIHLANKQQAPQPSTQPPQQQPTAPNPQVQVPSQQQQSQVPPVPPPPQPSQSQTQQAQNSAQVTTNNLFNAAYRGTPGIHVGPPSSTTGLPNLLPNMNFQLNKTNLDQFHHQAIQSQAVPSSVSSNGQRWPAPIFHHYQNQIPVHTQHDLVNQLNYTTNMNLPHIAQLAPNLSHNTAAGDLLAGLENGNIGRTGNSPAMSPVSSAGSNPTPVGESNIHKIEDRKVPPRPIGTERSWKNFPVNNPLDVNTSGNWVMGEHKITPFWTDATINHMERPPIMRSIYEGNIPHVMENYQAAHVDSQHAFHNGGNAAALAMMGLPIIPHFNTASGGIGPELPNQDPVKLEQANWDASRHMPEYQEKPHGWSPKWSH